MCMFGLKYFRLRQKVKHLYKLLICAHGLCLFGVLILMIYKSSGVFLCLPCSLSAVHEETFLLELWFIFTSLLSQHAFLARSLWPFALYVRLLCFQLSSFHMPWSSLTSLAVLLAPPWFSSLCPFSGLSCTFLLALISPVPCLLYTSLLHGLGYPFHTPHLLSLVHFFPLSLSLPFSWRSSQ